jgi:hypothetical protein
MFLSDIGIKYSVSFYPETAKEKKDLSEIMKKYSKGAMASATDDLASEKVFVFTDKEVAFNAGLIAQSTNTKSYILSLNYNRVSRNIKNTASDLDASLQNKIGEVTESFNYTTRVFFMAMLLCENSLENYGLLKYDLLVLFFYFINKHIFVAKEKVLDFFQYYLPTKNRAGAAVHTLYKSGFVKLGDVSEKERHTITTKGINLIMQYCRDVTKESII